LFDAVAALAGLSHEVSYEAEAAVALEMQAPDRLSKRESNHILTLSRNKTG